MAFIKAFFDFNKLLRFSQDKMLGNSDFFEETHIQIFKGFWLKQNETFLRDFLTLWNFLLMFVKTPTVLFVQHKIWKAYGKLSFLQMNKRGKCIAKHKTHEKQRKALCLYWVLIWCTSFQEEKGVVLLKSHWGILGAKEGVWNLFSKRWKENVS